MWVFNSNIAAIEDVKFDVGYGFGQLLHYHEAKIVRRDHREVNLGVDVVSLALENDIQIFFRPLIAVVRLRLRFLLGAVEE